VSRQMVSDAEPGLDGGKSVVIRACAR
jgi:hypothetical protein